MRTKRKIPDGDCAFDVETTGLDYDKGDAAFAMAFCNAEGEVGYFDWPVDPKTRKVEPVLSELNLIKKWAADERITKVMHNSTFDIQSTTATYGFRWRGVIHDTMLAAHCADSAEKSYGLKELWSAYTGEKRDDVDELRADTIRSRRRADQLGYSIADAVEADYWLPKVFNPRSRLCEQYALLDVQHTMLLWLFLRSHMEKHLAIRSAYELELELQKLIWRMERRGIRFDPAVNQRELRRHRKLAREALCQLRKIAGDAEFNPNSAKQIIALLHHLLGLPVLERTPTGQPKTSQDVLVAYQAEPAVQALLKFRACTKAVTSFFLVFQQKAVPDPLVPGGYCIRPHFRQAGKRTGRLSCAGPNLQGIADPESSRSESPISARTPFVPRPGYVIIAVDYSQLEVRIFAVAAQEKVLIAAFASGRDLHTETANRAWGGIDNPRAIIAAKAALDEDSDEIAEAWLAEFGYDIVAAEASLDKKNSRARGKTIIFSRIMGGGPRSIRDKLHCSDAEARDFIRAFDEGVPGIKTFLNRCQREAQKQGYITTLFGRQLRMLPDEYWKAGPYRVQGTAADFIKRRMLAVDSYFREHHIDAHILLQIHDELLIEIHQDALNDQLLRSIRRVMEDHEGRFNIDLPVELNLIRKSWAEKEKIDLPRLRNGVWVRMRRRRS